MAEKESVKRRTLAISQIQEAEEMEKDMANLNNIFNPGKNSVSSSSQRFT
jgi:hypothetical protein